MKIFDYTNGEAGKLLAEVPVAQELGSFIVKKGATFKVSLTKPVISGEEWVWRNSADNGEAIKPENFGVEAICFCIGEIDTLWHKGHPDHQSVWSWSVIGTPAWNKQACINNIIKAIKLNEVAA
jgi:hypothetical protein